MTFRAHHRAIAAGLLALLMVAALVTTTSAGAQNPAENPPDPCAETDGRGNDGADDANTGKNRKKQRKAPEADTGTGEPSAAAPSQKGDQGGGDGSESPDPCEPEPVPPQVSLQGLVPPEAAAIDLELLEALETAGFIDTWYSITSTHPRLTLLAVTGVDADEARTALLGHMQDLVVARETATVLAEGLQTTIADQQELELEIAAVDAEIEKITAERDRVDTALTALRVSRDQLTHALQGTAIGLYVNDTQVGDVGALDDVDTYNAQQEIELQVDTTLDDLLAQRDEIELHVVELVERSDSLGAAIALQRIERAVLTGEAKDVADAIERLSERITETTIRQLELEDGMPAVIGEAQRARLLAEVPALGISLVTLDAYVRGAEAIVDRYPSCAIRWQLLAGIATVESDHARFGGAWVAADGQVQGNRILGPLLDGTLEDTAVIRDTDGGAMDGNTQYDAAVGPFQFIPGTWRSYALDATGDGYADPHNLYDAALSAAGYLCASSSMADDAGIRASVLAYNHSGHYLAAVTGFASRYIVGLTLPEPAYDPETIDPRDGWGVHFGDQDPWAELGVLGRPGTGDGRDGSPEALELTGDD